MSLRVVRALLGVLRALWGRLPRLLADAALVRGAEILVPLAVNTVGVTRDWSLFQHVVAFAAGIVVTRAGLLAVGAIAAGRELDIEVVIPMSATGPLTSPTGMIMMYEMYITNHDTRHPVLLRIAMSLQTTIAGRLNTWELLAQGECAQDRARIGLPYSGATGETQHLGADVRIEPGDIVHGHFEFVWEPMEWEEAQGLTMSPVIAISDHRSHRVKRLN